jgi:GTP-binding protein
VEPSSLDYRLPSECRPEVAVLGRSNVGKSSLVGALLGNRAAVRVSKTPGTV